MENLEINYEDFVEERVRTDGPVSFSQLKEELENERRYDSFTDPADVRLEDGKELMESFHSLRQRNMDNELEGEIAASYGDGELYLRFMDDEEIFRPEGQPYTIE